MENFDGTGEELRGVHCGIILKLVLDEVEFEVVDRIDLAQDRDQWRVCEHGCEPSGSMQGHALLR
jgi:hypothetical protein